MTSREFNQDTGGAKRAAENGPVFITDRGQPSHVLLTVTDYQRLAARHASIVDQLGEPAGVEDVDLEIPVSSEHPSPASFD
jgi:prevent-host-death family protein